MKKNNKSARNAIIIESFKNGKGYSEIAQLFNISKQRVFQIINKTTIRASLPISIKNAILQRDNFSCQWGECCEWGDETKLNVHHIDLNPENNNPENLITLCEQCHRAFHALEAGWIPKKIKTFLKQVEEDKKNFTILCAECGDPIKKIYLSRIRKHTNGKFSMYHISCGYSSEGRRVGTARDERASFFFSHSDYFTNKFIPRVK